MPNPKPCFHFASLITAIGVWVCAPVASASETLLIYDFGADSTTQTVAPTGGTLMSNATSVVYSSEIRPVAFGGSLSYDPFGGSVGHTFVPPAAPEGRRIGTQGWGSQFNTARYVEFTITPPAGHRIDAETFFADFASGSNEVRHIRLRYSVDGAAFVAASEAGSNAVSNEWKRYTVTLAGVSASQSLVFRIEGRTPTTTGNVRLDNLTLVGTVVPLGDPPPDDPPPDDPPPTSDVDAALATFDAHYQKFLLPWLASLHDSASGGQRITSIAAAPDIQSSAQFVTIAGIVGVRNTMPEHIRLRLVNYFQTRQNPVDGFFYDHPGQNLSDRDKGRYLSYARGALTNLGAEPLHPLPNEDSSGVPSHLATATAYRTWLEGLPWNTPWAAGDSIDSQQSIIALLSHRDALLAEQWSFLPTRQSATTGYWGTNTTSRNYEHLSGAAKISAVYVRWNQPVPSADLLYDSGKWTLHNQSSGTATHVRNVLWLFSNIRSSMSGPIPEADRPGIINRTASNIALFLKPDGGFSMQTNNRSHMDGASQATRARNWSYTVVAYRENSLPWPGAAEFWSHPSFAEIPPQGGVFEAESLLLSYTGPEPQARASNSASDGALVEHSATSNGQFIRFTTPPIAPGIYRLVVRLRGGSSRAIVSTTFNDQPIGQPMDLYEPPSSFSFQTFDLGFVQQTSAGPANIRLTATGKNAASSAFWIVADRFDLIPPPGIVRTSGTPGTNPQAATDDNPLTAWSPNQAGDQLVLELGIEREWRGLLAAWQPSGSPAPFQLEYSLNGNDWAPLSFTQSSTTDGLQCLLITPTAAGFIRIVANSAAASLHTLRPIFAKSYEQWRSETYGPGHPDGEPLHRPDGYRSNLERYAFGDSAPAPRIELTSEGPVFRFWCSLEATGITTTARWSSDLQQWHTLSSAALTGSYLSTLAEWQALPLTLSDTGFFKLHCSMP